MNAARSRASGSRSTSRSALIGAGGQATGPSSVMGGNLSRTRRAGASDDRQRQRQRQRLLTVGPDPDAARRICRPSPPPQTRLDVLITSLNRASRQLDGVTFGGCGKVLATATNEETEMNHDDALQQLSHIAHERAFGRYVGSDRLIQMGLDALMAGVESPSLAMLAGLLRSEEPEPQLSSTRSWRSSDSSSNRRPTLGPRSGPWPTGLPVRSWTDLSIPLPAPAARGRLDPRTDAPRRGQGAGSRRRASLGRTGHGDA